MPVGTPHATAKDVFNVIRRSPALLITIVIILVVVGYLIYKQNQGSSTSSTSPADASGTPGYFLVYNEATTPAITINDQDSTTHPAPMPAPGTPTGALPPHAPIPTKPVPKPIVTKSATSNAQYVTVQPWPQQLSTLWGIAQYSHVPLSQVEALNPQYKANYNLIYAGQKVRVR